MNAYVVLCQINFFRVFILSWRIDFPKGCDLTKVKNTEIYDMGCFGEL